MSNLYVHEPPTSGKVVLKTTYGDIDVELWAKEAPKAARNFIQLCLEGYYDGTIFNRVIKGFIVQGGDPTGTGDGGESIYGGPFADEIHQRLRFTRRGMLGMASSGPNTNQSQFFFTLDRADDLNKKHTIFGKITGDSIFNALRMGDVETDKDDKPLFPPTIMSTEVLSNPFDDIVPRNVAKKKEAEATKKVEKKGVKKLNLLSFGDEALEEEIVLSKANTKIKSSHDLLDDERLSKEAVKVVPAASQPPPQKAAEVPKPAPKKKRTFSSDEEDLLSSDDDSQKKSAKKDGGEKRPRTVESDKQDRMDSIQKEINEVKDGLFKMNQKKEAPKPVAKKVSALEEQRSQYLTNKAKLKQKGREDETLEKLQSFVNKLRNVQPTEAPKQDPQRNEEVVCERHSLKNCQSCRDTFGEKVDGTDQGWMSHELRFEKKPIDPFARRDNIDDYVIIDPRIERKKDKGKSDKRSQKDDL